MTAKPRRAATRQLFRFGVVGLVVNLLLYIAFLALVEAGIEVKLAMTLAYAAGVILGYALNGHWTFGAVDFRRGRWLAYVTVYAAGYLLNLGVLALLVDRLGAPHALVQAAMVFLVAGFTFAAQKYWVFRPPACVNGSAKA
jgi:putative flippase GtrA